MDSLTPGKRVLVGRGALGALVVLWLVIRVTLFVGGVSGSSDAPAYAQHAYNLVTGQYRMTTQTDYFGFRYVVLLPTALAYWLFGVTDWSSVLFPLLASLATLLLVVRLGTVWFDRQTGLLAGLLYSFFPLDCLNATLLGASNFVPLLSSVAILAFWQAGQTPTSRRRPIWCFASGLGVGLCTLAREFAIPILGSIGLMALDWRTWRERIKGISMVGTGFATPLLLEGFYYWYATGDLFSRVTVIRRHAELYGGGPVPRASVSWAHYPRALLGLDLDGLAHFGFFAYLALGAIVLAAIRKELNSLRLLLFWIVPVFGYLEFGSMSLTHYLPMIKEYAYLSFISVPLVLLGAYGLMAILKIRRRTEAVQKTARWRAAIVALGIAGLAATSLYGVYRVRENYWDDSHPYQVVAETVKAHPERPIFVPNVRWALFLNYLLRYHTGFNYYNSSSPDMGTGRIHYLWEIQDASRLPAAYVVIHDRYLYYDGFGRPVGRVQKLPAYVFSPPSSWRVVVQEHVDSAYNSFALYETDRE